MRVVIGWCVGCYIVFYVQQDGWTALMLASYKGYTGCVEELLKSTGIDVNKQDNVS